MNDKIKDYILYGVAALTLINTYFVFTNSGSGRVIDTPSSNTALVESSRADGQFEAPNTVSKTFDAPTGNTEVVQPAKPAGPPTTLAFEQMEHDFGTIKQNSENKHIFKFVNTGPNQLIIQDAKGSCGCTVPKYPKEPVAPGETAQIEVVYKPGTQRGSQSKTVTITANTEPGETVLKISAMVEPEKEDS
ncbi:MAG: DUF1573 domain-containing protein [Flavobacteriales bacterium]|nr:DUF1573 domain-containing protein [Flavobacteriales bacterium]